MKNALVIVMIVCVGLGGWKFYNYCLSFGDGNHDSKPAAAEATPDHLTGMPGYLEPALQEARQRGAKGLQEFLSKYAKTMSDPRLASVELDYVALVSMTDAAEARRVFAKVKERTTPSSPLYKQVQQMQKTYE